MIERFPPFVSLLPLLLVCFAAGLQAQEQPKISDIQARAFESRTGDFSADLLSTGRADLGNMPIGETASVSTFVIVKVDFGKDSPIPEKAGVRLVATESGSMPFSIKRKRQADKIILDSTNAVGLADANGTTYVGFWLMKTGCQSIKLTATLTGVSKKSSKTEILAFTCYE